MVSLDLALIQDKIGKLAAKGLFKRVIMCRMADALPPVTSLLFRLLKRKELAKIPENAPYLEYRQLIAGAPDPAEVSIDPEADIELRSAAGHVTVRIPLAGAVAGEWLACYRKLALAAKVPAQAQARHDQAWIVVSVPAASDHVSGVAETSPAAVNAWK